MTKADHRRNNMLTKELTRVLNTEKFQAFTLTKIGYEGRMGSTMIIFSPEGIVILGDLVPGHSNGNGVVSTLGYGIGWFSGQLSPHYLAEKFLRQGWHAELAVEELKEWQKNGGNQYYDDETPLSKEKQEELQELIDYLECGDIGPERYYDVMMEIYDNPDIFCDGAPGHGYDPSDLGWLVAIQVRFAELYREKYATEET